MVLAAAIRGFSRALAMRKRAFRRLLFGSLGALWLAVNIVCWIWWASACLTVLILTTLGVWVLLWLEFDQFWRLGLMGSDRTVSAGLDYRKALALTQHSLDFLGVGASKLTREALAFEEAVARCNNPDRPIRMLLSHPKNQELERWARQAGRDPSDYRASVMRSLQEIARLVRQRAFNIDVRLYRPTAIPLLRLMFIDDHLCLASPYVFGKGDGSQLPQLHIEASPGPSLYSMFQRYFDRMWHLAEPWTIEDFAT
jgi:hypothetical protein